MIDDPTIIKMFLFACIGGVILNIMPCVLPVLALKAFQLISHKEQRTKPLLGTALGIILSMIGLGTLVVGLRQSGHAFGWGVQFQNPIFVALLMVCVLYFACMLWELCELRMPVWISNKTPTSQKSSHSLLESVVTGFFVTLLATPCTAPFLGVAVGFALTQTAGVIFLIFLGVGLGLASPYLVLSVFPSMLHLLPRPGSWMRTVKKIMGFLLIATALWLWSILSRQVSYEGLLWIGFSALGFVFFIWLRSQSRIISLCLWLGAFVCTALVAYGAYHFQSDIQVNTQKKSTEWTPFSKKTISDLVQVGKKVFVNVTADWCLTCKTNEYLVFNTDRFQKLVKQHGISLMSGDYTNPNPKILDFIQSHQRFGVPVYVYYSPKYPSGKVLPELVSFELLEEIFKD